MKTETSGSKQVDQYIAGYPADIQKILEKIRATVRKAAPDAEEAIHYGVPTFIQDGNLVHFGAAKKHIGFYPTPSAIAAFQKELSAYEGSKGSVQFPYDKPIPYSLIAKIVKYRVKEIKAKTQAKQKKK